MHICSRPRIATKLKIQKITALIALLVISGCSLVHKRVETEKLLTPLANANTLELIAAVNKLVSVQSIHGLVDIQFEDLSYASSGLAEKYRNVPGSITLQRPGKIYLNIQAPVVASDIVQMTSDGEHFRIAILKGDEKYRKFVKGTNSATYARFDRVGGIRFARLQSFDANGALVNDVTYGPLAKFGPEGNLMLPAKISLTRPHDQYKVSITYQTPDSLTINHDYPPYAFILNNK